MVWCVYYVDGKRFSSLDGQPQEAPGGGVLAVVQDDAEVGVLVHQQNDFYCYGEEFGGWAGMDVFGLAQYLMKPGFKVVKLGEVMSTDKYKAMLAEIRKNPMLPSKSARYPWEASS